MEQSHRLSCSQSMLWKCRFFFLALSITILLIISWSIVPNVLLELPFCSVRMMLLALMCDVSGEVMILDRILQITGRDVIGL